MFKPAATHRGSSHHHQLPQTHQLQHFSILRRPRVTRLSSWRGRRRTSLPGRRMTSLMPLLSGSRTRSWSSWESTKAWTHFRMFWTLAGGLAYMQELNKTLRTLGDLGSSGKNCEEWSTYFNYLMPYPDRNITSSKVFKQRGNKLLELFINRSGKKNCTKCAQETFQEKTNIHSEEAQTKT